MKAKPKKQRMHRCVGFALRRYSGDSSTTEQSVIRRGWWWNDRGEARRVYRRSAESHVNVVVEIDMCLFESQRFGLRPKPSHFHASLGKTPPEANLGFVWALVFPICTLVLFPATPNSSLGPELTFLAHFYFSLSFC